MFDTTAMRHACREILFQQMSNCFTSTTQDHLTRDVVHKIESFVPCEMSVMVAFHLGRIEQSTGLNLYQTYVFLDSDQPKDQTQFITNIILASQGCEFDEVINFQRSLEASLKDSGRPWNGVKSIVVNDNGYWWEFYRRFSVLD